MEQAKLTIRVPLEKQDEVGLRKISSKKGMSKKFLIRSQIKAKDTAYNVEQKSARI